MDLNHLMLVLWFYLLFINLDFAIKIPLETDMALQKKFSF